MPLKLKPNMIGWYRILTFSKKRPHWKTFLIFWESQWARRPDDWYPESRISISTNPSISFMNWFNEISGWFQLIVFFAALKGSTKQFLRFFFVCGNFQELKGSPRCVWWKGWARRCLGGFSDFPAKKKTFFKNYYYQRNYKLTPIPKVKTFRVKP